ncbi:Sepiapterin reductase [bacterium HR11]|nr:Sepiapterin reductase [bacterium HR11]
MSWEGRAAIVTGAGRGIGRAIARALGRERMWVGLLGRRVSDLEAVAEEVRKAGGRPVALQADVRDYVSLERAFQAFWDVTGRLDVLVNNAGIGIFRPVEEMTPEEFDDVIRTNLHGVFYCCKLAIPLMRRTGRGYIIQVGSLAGRNPIAGGAAYCASKFAVRGFSESLMLEVRYDDIKVTTIAPGSVDTHFGGHAGGEAWKLRPEDVAQVVVDLLHTAPHALASYVELRPLKPRK